MNVKPPPLKAKSYAGPSTITSEVLVREARHDIRSHNAPSWVLNDVAWLGTSQGLLREEPSSLELIQQTCTDLIEGDTQFSEDHISVLAEMRNGPLGRYFETLVQTVISLSPQVKNFHPNVVIHDGSRTCGELDLVYEHSGRWVHLELAVKFYMGLEDRSDQFQWYGPAGRDTLGRKLNRLFEHQLRLPETDAGRLSLAKFNIGDVRSEALVMGMLFHPFVPWQEGNFDAPAIIAKNHPAGWWLRRGDFNRLSEYPETMWKILSKPEWLSPAKPGLEKMLGRKVLSEHLKAALPSYPVMVAALVDGEECHRGFIVPDDWPPLQTETHCA